MSDAVQLHSCQSLTPETETSTHYFFQQSHQKGKLDVAASKEMTEKIYNTLLEAFHEDRNMITSQFKLMQQEPNAHMLPLAMDAALMRFRRLLEQRVNQEKN